MNIYSNPGNELFQESLNSEAANTETQTKNYRCFNTTGACDSRRHYMVDIQKRLQEIKILVDNGKYFTINRARQYGKTTTLKALTFYLRADYIVLPLDFQRIGDYNFKNEHVFSLAFADRMLRRIRNRKDPISGFSKECLQSLEQEARENSEFSLVHLFNFLNDLCDTAQKPVVLIIDEVDTATNNQVFLDFLSQLRADYLDRDTVAAFQSVILAGVYDVKNIRRKIRPDEEHKVNSPWNTRESNEESASLLAFDDCPRNHKEPAPYDVAADFNIDMSFSVDDIKGMLKEYETDYHTGMDTDSIAGLLYRYTSGYPFLVSRLCQLIDTAVAGSPDFPDKKAAWTQRGFLEAEKMLLTERNTLFESLMGKLLDYPDMRKTLYSVLFEGKNWIYSAFDASMDAAIMFGFLTNQAGNIRVSNRIFETLLYDYFLTDNAAQSHPVFQEASQNKSQFIQNGRLNMKRILQNFVELFNQIYGDHAEPFDEDEGRRRFLLYLRPIINGTGNYYIEPETRNSRRMDVVVDYQGEQFIIELKIWRGNAYNERGEKQLSDYLDYFKLKKGYMLSYNFNQKKKIGVKEISIGNRILVEAVV